jgi:3'-phosphoadenosine 5'-phosphosulfate (PAPS) 3'-phosphatase
MEKFHVDNLSSAHVYLRLPEAMTWDAIPAEILAECAQLTKANSIDGTTNSDILSL